MNDNPVARKKWFERMEKLWPALKGSLAKVYKPCIRKNCPACARGDKHPAWLLSATLEGRRRTLYVPQALVPLIRRGIQNGRKLEKLLYQAGPDLIKAHRSSVRKGVRKPPTKS